MLAGRGGLNITHSEDFDSLLGRYGNRRSALEHVVRAFSPDDLREWCAGLGEPTFVGTSGRVFPESFKATPLLRAWLARLDGLGVKFATRHHWNGWVSSDGGSLRFAAAGEDHAEVLVAPDITIFALGGASWPRVSSDGGWLDHFVNAGVATVPFAPTNCGVQRQWTPVMVERFAGHPLKNIAIDVAGCSVRGDAMVTRSGLEGGPVYAHSARLRELLQADKHWSMKIDLRPDLAHNRVVDQLTKARRPKDSVSTWLRKAGVDKVRVALLREATGNAIPTVVDDLAGLIKALPLAGEAMMPIDRAISTAGGISFDALDNRLMLQSRPGIFLAGEMLDWEAPTGGYLLQACFSSGVAAANGALVWHDENARS